MNSKYNSIEKAFYSDGFKLAMKALGSENRKDSINTAIAEMHETIDQLIDSLSIFAKQQNQTIDCKKGCSWCCYQPVFALDYELDYLKSFIEKNFSPDRQNEIKLKAKPKNDKLSKLEGDKLLNSKFACPLLENDACSAYEARPVACRIYLSTNLNSCRIFYEDPQNKNSFPALLDFPMKAGRMINEGFKAALKASGASVQEFRIEEKLL